MHLRRFPPYKYHKLDLYLSRPIFRYLLTDSKQPQLRKDRLKCFTILLKETRNEAESNFSLTKLFMSKNIENASPVRELVKIDKEMPGDLKKKSKSWTLSPAIIYFI